MSTPGLNKLSSSAVELKFCTASVGGFLPGISASPESRLFAETADSTQDVTPALSVNKQHGDSVTRISQASQVPAFPKFKRPNLNYLHGNELQVKNTGKNWYRSCAFRISTSRPSCVRTSVSTRLQLQTRKKETLQCCECQSCKTGLQMPSSCQLIANMTLKLNCRGHGSDQAES